MPRVCSEGLVVKYFQRVRKVLWLLTAAIDVTQKKHRLTCAGAAAVIRRVQALIGITGRKHAGGLPGRM